MLKVLKLAFIIPTAFILTAGLCGSSGGGSNTYDLYDECLDEVERSYEEMYEDYCYELYKDYVCYLPVEYENELYYWREEQVNECEDYLD